MSNRFLITKNLTMSGITGRSNRLCIFDDVRVNFLIKEIDRVNTMRVRLYN